MCPGWLSGVSLVVMVLGCVAGTSAQVRLWLGLSTDVPRGNSCASLMPQVRCSVRRDDAARRAVQRARAEGHHISVQHDSV